MLEWADVCKIALGFASSLILIWIKELFVHYRQVAGLRKSLWSMMEFESDLENFLGTLERMKASISEGNLMLVAFDVPKSITSAAEELAHLEPKNAYIYNDLHSHSEIVRSGLTLLRELLKSLATMKPNPVDEVRLRKAIIGQIDILKSDRLSLARAEIRVMDHIRGHHSKLNKVTVDKMKGALGRYAEA